MIHGAPEVVHLAVDLHVNLVQVPLPVRKGLHPTDPVSADLCCKHRAKSVPPITHSFVADLYAALVQKIFNIAKRKGNRTYIMTARRMISGLVLK